MIDIKTEIDLRRERKDGKYPIIFRLRGENIIRLSTGFSATVEEWEDGEYSKFTNGYKAKNIRLRQIALKIESALFKLEESGKMSFLSDRELREIISSIIKGNDISESIKLVDVFDRFISTKTNKGTIGLYEATKRQIEDFDPKISLNELNSDWVSKFEREFINRGCKTNYIGIQLRNIRAVFNYAIDNELTQNYPFRRFKIKKEETAKRALSIEEIRTLRDYAVEPYLEKYRDMFMLMFYLIGINAADLFNLPPLKGNKIIFHRAKTNKLYEIKIEPEALEIIRRYEGEEYMLSFGDEYKNYQDFLRHIYRIRINY